MEAIGRVQTVEGEALARGEVMRYAEVVVSVVLE